MRPAFSSALLLLFLSPASLSSAFTPILLSLALSLVLLPHAFSPDLLSPAFSPKLPSFVMGLGLLMLDSSPSLQPCRSHPPGCPQEEFSLQGQPSAQPSEGLCLQPLLSEGLCPHHQSPEESCLLQCPLSHPLGLFFPFALPQVVCLRVPVQPLTCFPRCMSESSCFAFALFPGYPPWIFFVCIEPGKPSTSLLLLPSSVFRTLAFLHKLKTFLLKLIIC